MALLKTLDFSADFAKRTFRHLSLNTDERTHSTLINLAPPFVRCSTMRNQPHLADYTVIAAQGHSTLSEIQISHGDERPVCFGSTTFLRF